VPDETGHVGVIDGEFVRETLYGKVVIHTPADFPRNRLYWIVPRLRQRIRRWYRRHVYWKFRL
jgi:hypothetical protein